MNWSKIALLIIGIPLLYVVFCIIYAKITYYNPPTEIIISENKNAPILDSSDFSFMTWNIGYAGLGEKSDFFYDGGKMMRPEEIEVKKNMDGILNTLSNQKNDFILLQEVDSFSKRSYFTPELELLTIKLKALYHSYFSLNYKVNYIPMPWLEPMGKVNSGLLTLSKYETKKVVRHQLPGEFGFPKQLFFLRRCLLVSYYNLSNGKELVIVNIHNSAYDDNGKLKSKEMTYLKSILEKEFKVGNYVLCGGDWNQCPPDFKYNSLAKGKQGDYLQTNIDSLFLPNWNWTYDPSIASNRKNDKAYSKESTFTTIIDFYLTSPNIEIKECKGIDQEFKYSDHQPVTINIKLK